MKKRIISLVLIVAMVMSLFSSTFMEASAESTSQPVISVEDAWAAAGSTVEVNIVISKNPGILGATLTLSWAEGLTLLDAENGDAFVNLSYQGSNNYKPDGTNFVWYGNKLNAVKDGTVLKLTFKVEEDANVSSKLAVNVTGSGIIDVDKNPVSAIFAGGGIRIVDYTPGDVDGNEEIDTPDLIMLAKYIVDGCKTDPNGYNVSPNLNASDVNDDGEYTALDLVLISQYIVDGCKTDPDGYNVVLKPVTPKCSHSSMEGVDYKEATCTEDGNISYYYCADCESYFNNSEATLELFWEQIVLVSPGHNEVIDQAVPPSYDEPGLTEGSHCSVCDKVFVPQEEVPILQAKYHSITYRNLNGAESPEPSSYAEHKGLNELPVPEATGYIFRGWYTDSDYNNKLDYINPGDTKDYILYARWEVITYHLYFNKDNAPEHNNPTTYTVEDRIILEDPTWAGLAFTGWTDENGKTWEEIPVGTTGDITLTAHWKQMRNIATPGTNTLMKAEYYAHSNLYAFIYELGTIEHVVLEELNDTAPNTYYHSGAGDFTLGVEQTLEMSEEVAESIAKTISKSVATSNEWEESKEWAEEQSIEHSTNESIGIEIGQDEWPVKTSIEASYGYANTSGKSWGESSTQGGSYGEEVENGEETSSSLAYTTTLSTTTSSSITIPKDSPNGYYSYAHVGNIRVFGIVTYDPNTGRVYLNTYSMLDNMHDMLLYYPDVDSMNHPTCETLEYKIPRDQISEALNKAYFVEYDANGGQGSMNNSLHTIGGEEAILENQFTREGYVFMGWESRNEDGTIKSVFTDGQVINDIAQKGELVTLYAQWTPNNYTISYQGNKPTNASTTVSQLSGTMACKYDENVTLAAAPYLPGYTFRGWYSDKDCTQFFANAGQTVKNVTSEVNGAVTLYAKWTPNTYTVTFNADGGSMANTTMNVVFDTPYGTLPIPTKKDSNSDNIFMGWYDSNGVKVTEITYARVAGNHTLKAKWLKTKETVYYRDDALQPGEKDIRVTDSKPHYEMCSPGMDLAALKAQGYTRLLVEYEFWTDEIDQGNKHIMFMPYYKCHYDYDFYTQNFNDQASGWDDAVGSTYINLNSGYLDENCGFWVGYGAHGNDADDYYLGDAKITITALKN